MKTKRRKSRENYFCQKESHDLEKKFCLNDKREAFSRIIWKNPKKKGIRKPNVTSSELLMLATREQKKNKEDKKFCFGFCADENYHFERFENFDPKNT